MADISSMTLLNGDTYDLKDKIARASIPYAQVDSTSTATVYTATVEGITELYDGVTIMLHNGVVTSASGFTVNINNLGAKKCYNNMTNATQDTTIFNVAYTMLFVYSEALDGGNGGWWIYRGYDANTNTIGYQLRTNSANMLAVQTGYRYRLWFTDADGQGWVPANTSSATDATKARALNTRPIDPFGAIVYCSHNATKSAGAGLGTGYQWTQYTLTIGYSYVKALVSGAPVYLKCTPQADGSAVMTDIATALPTTKDGSIYIFLGVAYSTTAMELEPYHPVYWHDGNGIRLWTGAEPPSGGSTVSVSQTLTSGTEIGSVSVDGTATKLYAPTPQSITVDSELSSTSENPVQNKVINSAIAAKYTKPNLGIPASDLAPGAIPSVPSGSSQNPKMDGTASAGTAGAWSRADHVHPTDTSRQAVITLSGILKGNGSDGVGVAEADKDYVTPERLQTAIDSIIPMTILSYGTSTWSDFLTAYYTNSVVYCRASSNSDPATGSQTRLAFMAYVNNAANPTEVEFQYYRSVATHSDAQQGDQVYVYKLTSSGDWTVTTRSTFTKIAAGTNLTSSYSNGVLTLNGQSGLPTVSASDNGKVLTVVNGAWAAASLPVYDGSVT